MQTDRQTDPPLPVLDDPFTFPFTVHRRTFVIPFGSPGVRLPFTWCTTEKEPFFSPTIGLEPLLERGSLLPVPLSGVWNVHSAWNPRGELLFRENVAAPHHSFLPFVEVTVPSTASPRPSPSPYLFCFDQRKGEKFSPRDFMTYYYIVLPEDWSTDMFPRRGITIPPPPTSPRKLEKEMDICSHLFALSRCTRRRGDYLFYARALLGRNKNWSFTRRAR